MAGAPSGSPSSGWAARRPSRGSCGPGKPGRSPALRLSIGLLCSKTFDDAIFAELFDEHYGLERADILKMNIKGVFQIWMRDAYHSSR